MHLIGPNQRVHAAAAAAASDVKQSSALISISFLLERESHETIMHSDVDKVSNKLATIK